MTGGADGKIIIWSLLDYAPLHTISKAHENAVTSLDVRDGQILSGGSDGAVKLWDLHTGEVVGDIGMLTQAVWKSVFGTRREQKVWSLCQPRAFPVASAYFDACLDVSDNMAVYRSTNTDTSRYGRCPNGPLRKERPSRHQSSNRTSQHQNSAPQAPVHSHHTLNKTNPKSSSQPPTAPSSSSPPQSTPPTPPPPSSHS